MNTYLKYAAHTFIAVCTEEHTKGDTITLTTRRGKENEHIVHNFLGYKGTKEKPLYCYSITRADGYNLQERAKKKAANYDQWAKGADKKSSEWHEKSREGADFLSLGEPIKVGHHSEKRHRALIDRNWNRLGNAVKESDKAESHRDKAEYWKSRESEINLSIPESLEYYTFQLEEAKKHHKGLKDGTIKRSHDYSLTYANKKVKDLTKKVELAQKLWDKDYHIQEFKVGDTVHFQAYTYDKPKEATVKAVQRGRNGDNKYMDGTPDNRVFYSISGNEIISTTTGGSIVGSFYFNPSTE